MKSSDVRVLRNAESGISRHATDKIDEFEVTAAIDEQTQGDEQQERDCTHHSIELTIHLLATFL